LLNSKTGKFLIVLGGISDPATVIAGKLVSRESMLRAALRTAPAGWENKNLELLIETDRIGAYDLSTRVIAAKAL